MPYTPQVRINPSFAQYMQGRTGQFAYPGGGSAPGLTGGGNFGFPSYGNMYGNMMQSGQQYGVPAGVFGMPSTFYPGQQQQQQQPAQQQPAAPQSMVQQVAGASDYSQPNINFGDQGQRQTFLDEYKKLYRDQLSSKDKTYQGLNNANQSAYNAANAEYGNIQRLQNSAQRDKATGVYTNGPPAIANYQGLQQKQALAEQAREDYFNKQWQGQQAQLDSLFSGQITPQMLLQGMTRGLLG